MRVIRGNQFPLTNVQVIKNEEESLIYMAKLYKFQETKKGEIEFFHETLLTDRDLKN